MRSFQRWAAAVLMIGLMVPAQSFSVAGAAGKPAKETCLKEGQVQKVSRQWTKIAPPDPGAVGADEFLATDPSRPGQLFHGISVQPQRAIGYDRIYGSSDGGCTWELVLETSDLPTDDQPIARESHSIEAMAAGPGTLYVVLPVTNVFPGVAGVPSGYLGVTRDRGATWEYRPLPVGEWEYFEEPGSKGSEFHVSQADPDTVYLLARPKVTNLIPGPREGMRLFRSSDAGGSWQEVGRSPSMCSVAIDPLDPDVVWVWDDMSSFCTNANPVTRSINGGGVWQEVAVQMSQAHALGIFHRPGEPARILAAGKFGDEPVALLSNDGGLSWMEIDWAPAPSDPPGLIIFGNKPDEIIATRNPHVTGSSIMEVLRYDKRFDGWVNINPPGRPSFEVTQPQMVETGRTSVFYFLSGGEDRGIWRYAR